MPWNSYLGIDAIAALESYHKVGGEHVEGYQDLIPATQGPGTANGISPPGREGLVLQASEGNHCGVGHKHLFK